MSHNRYYTFVIYLAFFGFEYNFLTSYKKTEATWNSLNIMRSKCVAKFNKKPFPISTTLHSRVPRVTQIKNCAAFVMAIFCVLLSQSVSQSKTVQINTTTLIKTTTVSLQKSETRYGQ